MREIKFRAWDKKTQQICGVKVIDIFRQCVGFGWNEYDGIKWRDFKDVVLMQYTGARDKNGREIYEGDIIRHSSYFDRDGTKKDCLYVVCWDNDGLHFSYKSLQNVLYFAFDLGDSEVVGNIFENEDLLVSRGISLEEVLKEIGLEL